jgi:hypothetical protein
MCTVPSGGKEPAESGKQAEAEHVIMTAWQDPRGRLPGCG